jgi:hypothetical protein
MHNNLGVYPTYVQHYLDLVDTSDLFQAFQKQEKTVIPLFESIGEEKSTFSYAENKWTLKELLQHCIDTERIFCYRALCFARKEPAGLNGFDEDSYAAQSNAHLRSWKSLLEEYIVVRKSTECLFKSFPAEALTYTGIANNNESSVISIGFLIIGHLNHHINIIQERYI